MIFKSAFLLIAMVLLPQNPVAGADIYCHAAASLSDALQKVGDQFEKKTGAKTLFNFGASSLLARQIEEGSPADLFISADEAKVRQLAKKGLVFESTRRSLLSNTLVIVTARDSRITLQSATDLRMLKGRIAIAEYQSVPAGIYAKQYLEKIGLWGVLSERLVPVQNVRAALSAVEAGNVETGIVYRTDANVSRRVRIAYEIPRHLGPEISYCLVILKGSRNLSSAKKFYEYLVSPAALTIFRQFGFIAGTAESPGKKR